MSVRIHLKRTNIVHLDVTKEIWQAPRGLIGKSPPSL